MPAGVRSCRNPGAAGLLGGLVGLGAAALAGCRTDVPEASFQAPTPQARAAAVAEAVTERDRESIPDLIEALDDSDPVIRSWAIRGLEEMTGQTLGYDPFAPQGLRDEAVARWVAWQPGGGEADIVDGAASDADDPAPGSPPPLQD